MGSIGQKGQCGSPELQQALFTDVPENKLYRWDEKNGLQLYLEPSGYTGYAPNKKKSGGNGLILDENSHLLIAQHGDRRIARINSPLESPEFLKLWLIGLRESAFTLPMI